MRGKAYLEKYLVQAKADLIKARLQSGWENGLVGYLLGQVVTLKIVLDADLDWSTAYNVTIDQIDRSVAEIRKRED